MKCLIDSQGLRYVPGEIRVAGPFEYYINKWNERITYTGERKTDEPVLVVTLN